MKLLFELNKFRVLVICFIMEVYLFDHFKIILNLSMLVYLSVKQRMQSEVFYHYLFN